jgi:F-type H+-transporting ATPase subunit delta
MSEYQSIARPYAQAVFELARSAGNYPGWSAALAWASAIADDEQVRELAQNPRVDDAALVQLFADVAGDKLFAEAQNFLRLVVANDRVFALPHIAVLFEFMRAEAEGSITAKLVSAQEVSSEQQAQLAQSLSKRLGREVTLEVVQDPDLIGGAVLRAGDMVIDASIEGRLQKLAANLAR